MQLWADCSLGTCNCNWPRAVFRYLLLRPCFIPWLVKVRHASPQLGCEFLASLNIMTGGPITLVIMVPVKCFYWLNWLGTTVKATFLLSLRHPGLLTLHQSERNIILASPKGAN